MKRNIKNSPILSSMILMLAFFLNNRIDGQIIDHSTCKYVGEFEEYSASKSNSILSEPLNYIPYGDPGNYGLTDQPIKTIEIAFHIFQNENWNGNYQNNSTDIQKLKDALISLNEHYSSGEPTDPVPGCVQLNNYDSRIRFSLGDSGNERIFFYNDQDCYDIARTSLCVAEANSKNQYAGHYNVFLQWGTIKYKLQK